MEHITIWSAGIIGELLMPILNPSAPPRASAAAWWRLKWTSHKCNFTDFVLSVKYFREDLWSRTFYSFILKWRHESGTVGATPAGDKTTQSIRRVSGEQFKQDYRQMLLYTHSCNFPWYLTTIVFHARRRGALFICSEGCVVFVILGPTQHPSPLTPHLIWSDVHLSWDNPENQLNSLQVPGPPSPTNTPQFLVRM